MGQPYGFILAYPSAISWVWLLTHFWRYYPKITFLSDKHKTFMHIVKPRWQEIWRDARNIWKPCVSRPWYSTYWREIIDFYSSLAPQIFYCQLPTQSYKQLDGISFCLASVAQQCYKIQKLMIVWWYTLAIHRKNESPKEKIDKGETSVILHLVKMFEALNFAGRQFLRVTF